MTPSIHGNVIEYISDRLYLAHYTSAPTSQTPFPPTPIPDPYKLLVASQQEASGRSPRRRQRNVVTNSSGMKPVYFSVDDSLLYNAFHHDFGPMHIGHLYRFAVTLHDILGDPKHENRVVVFWSKPDARSRANAACLLACYMVLVQSWPPHLALSPLAQCDPPLMPFRDAGYSQADFILNVQDIVYGVWKAKEKKLLNLREFNLEEYERFERVDMGDFNWINANFLAFASPQFEHPEGELIPSNANELSQSNIPTPFKNVLEHFHQRDIGLVVRLNSHLYPAEYFTELGITHMDMIFDDGTCPPVNLVRKFVNLAHNMITVQNKNIAVHCKAGLGRTGCLIGAYLVYRYGFTANEVIAFMRFMRPGMVVGPQQHWLHLHQDEFRQWWFEDTILQDALEKQAATSVVIRTPTKTAKAASTPKRSVLGEIDDNESPPHDTHKSALPAPTPGQPRKANRSPIRMPSNVFDENEPDSPTSSPLRRRRPSARHDGVRPTVQEMAQAMEQGMTEEELMIRLHRKTSRSPAGGKRAVSYTTTTTATVSHTVTPPDSKSKEGRYATMKARTSPRRRPHTGAAGIRKSSAGGTRTVSGGGAPVPAGTARSPSRTARQVSGGLKNSGGIDRGGGGGGMGGQIPIQEDTGGLGSSDRDG